MESKAKLDHEPYEWSVVVKSSRSIPPSRENPQVFTLRLFIAAKDLMDDYHNWIEMDKVTVHLTDDSSITKLRLDTDSSAARKMGRYSESDPKFASPWCRCGWPQNMMLPVGKVEGMPFVAFCMATNDYMAQGSQTPDYFLPSDRSCMLREYGYDLSNYDDVKLHSAAIYDATVHKRMPLQMDPWTQENPDPSHPLWTDEMCNNFKAWMLNDCPIGKNPQGPQKPPSTTATWENPIKGYFLPQDTNCMKGVFDLSSHESVKNNAASILEAVTNKSMPKQMPPYTQENPDPRHPLWTDKMCNTFKAWMQNGCP